MPHFWLGVTSSESSPLPTDHVNDKRPISEVKISDSDGSDYAPASRARSTIIYQRRVCDFLFDQTLDFGSHDEAAKKSATLGNPDAVDADGFLADINIQSIDDNGSPDEVDKTQDVKEFFHAPFSKDVVGKDKKKLYHICKLCP